MSTRILPIAPWALVVMLVLPACSGPSVPSVSITEGDQTLRVGEQVQLSAQTTGFADTHDSLAWTSSSGSVAAVDEQSGLVAAVAVGVAEITATSVAMPATSGSITVTVIEPGRLAWQQQFGTNGRDLLAGTAVDEAGSIYLAGRTDGVLPGQTQVGFSDVYVRKLDSDGNVLWTLQFGTTSADQVSSMAIDDSGNVYVSGNTAPDDAFVAKVAADGSEVLWFHQFSVAGTDYAESVTVHPDGDVVVAGMTRASFGSPSVTQGMDGFVRKIDAAGQEVWTTSFGTAGFDGVNDVAVDDNGNIFVAGNTGDALSGFTNAGGADLMVLGFDVDGNRNWSHQLGTGEDDLLYGGIELVSDGSIILAGRTLGAFAGFANAGDADAFVLQVASDGSLRWVHQFGTADYDEIATLTIDGSGTVIVGGTTWGSLAGSANAGSGDAFVLALDATGSESWMRQFGSAEDDGATGVATDVNGNTVVAGYTLGELAAGSAGDYDVFLQKRLR